MLEQNYHDHFRRVSNKKIASIVKPQYVDKLPKVTKGKIKDILKKADTSGNSFDR